MMHLRTFYPKLVAAAIPNGAAVSPKQRMRLIAEGLLAGFPDLIVCEPRGVYHGLLVEMKSTADSATISPSQCDVQAKLRSKGYMVVTCYGYDDAKATVLAYLAL